MTQTSNTTDSFVLTAFAFEASLGVGALVVGWMVGVDPLSTVPVAEGTLNNHLLAIFWGVAATIPLLFGLLLMNRLRFRSLVRIRRFVAQRVSPLFEPLSLFELAAISFAAGFGEEMLFRGLLQSGIAERIGGPVGIATAVVLVSVLFGVCHWLTPTYAILATIAGAYFGVLFLLTGNLLAPLVAHALYDFLALVYLTRPLGLR
ncbi:MAG: CPBP family intramembrane metalloprotease [Planctomycetia bacterium]|nr:CPBP family intramembrane metalloprotease [Planctomycetia bacterium]